MGIIIIWIILSAIIGAIAKRRGKSFIVWFIVSIVITPIVSLILLILISILSARKQDSNITYTQVFSKYSDSLDQISTKLHSSRYIVIIACIATGILLLLLNISIAGSPLAKYLSGLVSSGDLNILGYSKTLLFSSIAYGISNAIFIYSVYYLIVILATYIRTGNIFKYLGIYFVILLLRSLFEYFSNPHIYCKDGGIFRIFYLPPMYYSIFWYYLFKVNPVTRTIYLYSVSLFGVIIIKSFSAYTLRHLSENSTNAINSICKRMSRSIPRY